MKNVSIVFEKDKGFFAWMIRWLTNSQYNHVAIEFESDDWDEPCAFEAVPKNGVRIIPSGHRQWLRRFRCKAENFQDAVVENKQETGELYDFRSFLMFGILLLIRKVFSTNIKKPWRSTKGQFCSELVAQILENIVSLGNPQWVTPQQILEVCSSRPDLFEELPCE